MFHKSFSSIPTGSSGIPHIPGRRQRNCPPSTSRFPSLLFRRLQNSYWEPRNTTLGAMDPSWVLFFIFLFFLLFLFVAFPFYSTPVPAPSLNPLPHLFLVCLFFCRSRSLGFCFFVFFCFVVCLPVRNSLWGRGRFALAVKSGRGLPLAGQHGP